MHRYYFDVIRPDGTARDEEGETFADLAAAREEAMRTAKQLTAECLRGGHSLATALEMRLDARDESGRIAFTVPFGDAANAEDYVP